MLFVIITLVVAMGMVQSQPVPCIEDSQCPDNFFCKVPAHICHECLDCRELNRPLPPNLKTPYKCVKTDEDCGPCFEGWRPHLMYDGNVKCEPTATKRVKFFTKDIYIWCTGAGAAAGFLITVIYLHIFQSSIFKVVNCYIPIQLTGIEQWTSIAKSSSSVNNDQRSTEEESCLFPDVIQV